MKEHTIKDRNKTTSDDIYRHKMHEPLKHLVSFRDLDDFQVAEGDSDVRGWQVFSVDNTEIGKVEEMIVDTDAMKVRYLLVDLYEDYTTDTLNHYMLIPIGAARLHESDNNVIVSGIKTTTILNYPPYNKEGITREYEYSVRNYFETGGLPTASSGTDRDRLHRSQPIGGTMLSATKSRYDMEASHMDETTRSDNDSIRSNNYTTSQYRDVSGAKPLGESNLTTGADANQRIRYSNLSPRTGSLGQEPIPQGPTGQAPNDYSRPVEPRENVAPRADSPTDDELLARPPHTEGEWRSTSNINSSTSLGNTTPQGTNYGNAEHRPEYGEGREMPQRRDIPEDINTNNLRDSFYEHKQFDEEEFYHVRRRRKLDE